jgi:hypothetical protein
MYNCVYETLFPGRAFGAVSTARPVTHQPRTTAARAARAALTAPCARGGCPCRWSRKSWRRTSYLILGERERETHTERERERDRERERERGRERERERRGAPAVSLRRSADGQLICRLCSAHLAPPIPWRHLPISLAGVRLPLCHALPAGKPLSFFFPCFYTMRELVNLPPAQSTAPSLSEGAATLGGCVRNGLTRYGENYWTDWLNSWSIWVPGYAITYGVCPVHLRMPFIASVSKQAGRQASRHLCLPLAPTAPPGCGLQRQVREGGGSG